MELTQTENSLYQGIEPDPTPVPTTVEQINGMSRWTIYSMFLGGKFRKVTGEIRTLIEQIADDCEASL